MRATFTMNSPHGPLEIAEEDGAIVSLTIGKKRNGAARAGDAQVAPAADAPTPLLAAAAAQLDAYFYCGLKEFDLPLAPKGSRFERAIWELMNEIPFGQTRSYGELARSATRIAAQEGLDVAAVARAVGQACGRNPIAIIQPCHRVMAKGGRIGGFSAPGGAETKLALLLHEGAVLV